MSVCPNSPSLGAQTCTCMWAAPEHVLECACVCPLHHELPHQLFKLYLIVQVVVSIHPARAELSEAAKTRSRDCYSSGTTVAIMTSGYADKHSFFDTTLFNIIQLYYTTHTTAISVVKRDAKTLSSGSSSNNSKNQDTSHGCPQGGSVFKHSYEGFAHGP